MYELTRVPQRLRHRLRPHPHVWGSLIWACALVGILSAGCGGSKHDRTEDQDDCKACDEGFECCNGVCTNNPLACLPAPSDPRCYTPCLQDLDVPDTHRSCPSSGLMEGCLDDATCVDGTCVPRRLLDAALPMPDAGDEAPGPEEAPLSRTCRQDIECPAFQVCLERHCYANCQTDDECPNKAVCVDRSCRLSCGASIDEACPKGMFCDTPDPDAAGVCRASAPAPTTASKAPSGSFEVSEEVLQFSNSAPSLTFEVKNDSDQTLEFTLRKRLQYEYTAAGVEIIERDPLPWLQLGLDDGAERVAEVKALIDAGADRTFQISGAVSEAYPRWSGELELSAPGLGTKTLRVEYAERPEGRWSGWQYYLANFGDDGLAEWIDPAQGDRGSNAQLGQVGNALVQRWAAFKFGRITWEEFDAALLAVVSGSWDWASTRELCSAAGFSKGACYLFDNSAGLLSFTADEEQSPVPSGVAKLPVAFDLKPAEDDGTVLGGRVVSAVALHYPGDPAAVFQFQADTSTCQTSFNGICSVRLDRLSAEVLTGGRYLLSQGEGCASGYTRKDYPWLLGDFLEGSAVLGDTRVRPECLDTRVVTSTAEAALNFARGNPLPDGRPRQRQLALIDGALINQEEMFVLFRERFDAKLDDAQPTFDAYGFMRLRREAAALGDDAYVGNAPTPVDTTKAPDVALKLSCDPELLDAAQHDLTDVVGLVNAVLNGVGGDSEAVAIEDGTVHYYCAETTKFDDHDCPIGSEVSYFRVPLNDAQVKAYNDQCPTADDANRCDLESVFDDYRNQLTVGVPYACDSGNGPDPNVAACDNWDGDLRDGKIFYGVAGTHAVDWLPLRAAVSDAFRYHTRFKSSRSNATVGFAPQLCEPGTPYCYDAAGIEHIRKRVDCLLSIYRDAELRAKLAAVHVAQGSSRTWEQQLRDYLTLDLGAKYQNGQLHADGFERLYAQLLITLGDDAYTSAFATRFDLAESNRAQFPGERLEAEGVNLTGAAGAEFANLYVAAQYYQLVLDRFYELAPAIYGDLLSGSGALVTQSTAVDYLGKVVRASTQKARAHGALARRYQAINEPALARTVLERAFSASYLEGSVLFQVMHQIAGTLASGDRRQVIQNLEQAQRVYLSAQMDMREVYESISDDQQLFGFAPDYIPFPAWQGTGQRNAVDYLLALSADAEESAAADERVALAQARSFAVDEATFSSQLIETENTYEKQLAEICGTFEGDDGRFYPAIPDYAPLSTYTSRLGSPCGLVQNGAIYEQILQVQDAVKGIAQATGRLSDVREKQRFEREALADSCRVRSEELCEEWQIEDRVNTLSDEIRDAEGRIRWAKTVADGIADTVNIVAGCAPKLLGLTVGFEPGTCIAASAKAAANGTFYGINIYQQDLIDEKQEKIEDAREGKFRFMLATEEGVSQGAACDAKTLERSQQAIAAGDSTGVTYTALAPVCQLAGIESDKVIKLLGLSLSELGLDLERADLQLRLAMSRLSQLYARAERLTSEQAEVEQMVIDIEAAKNDPNARVYKNGAILEADRTFEIAVRRAYEATKVFEYYTSQSYARLNDLFLVRTVQAGDGGPTIESYLDRLRDDWNTFQMRAASPSRAVMVVSLRDDILQIPRVTEAGAAIPQQERIRLLREQLLDGRFIDDRGALRLPFRTTLEALSPRTWGHRVRFVEGEMVGANLGDEQAEVILEQRGTSTMRAEQGAEFAQIFYALPQRNAKVTPSFNGVRARDQSIYRSEQLSDRPVVNTRWDFVLDQRDTASNRDIDLSTLTDIRLYVYYEEYVNQN